jgi:hypothetical protein
VSGARRDRVPPPLSPEAAVREALRATAADFGLPSADAHMVPLRFGPFIVEQGPPPAVDLAAGIELVYEGYLLHYRESRCAAAPPAPAQRLLAGDFFYARGLRLVAFTGDVEAVGLLTRLMAVCSYLRVEDAPFALDDELWDLTVLAVAGEPRGRRRRRATRAFDDVDLRIADNDVAGLPSGLAAALEDLRR